jgi:glycosyltransferase involved in cell wall biosynthesis
MRLPAVLHLAAWYPTAEEPWRTPFIPAHFHAAAQHGHHELVHIEVLHRQGLPRLRMGRHPTGERYRLLTLPTDQARVVELATLALLLLVRFELGLRWWDGVHVHIAWPLMRFPRFFMALFGKQVLIGEHWTAYRFRFHLPQGSRGHLRMAAMFGQQLPVTTVTRTLALDITRFAAPHQYASHIIPNIVDPLLFHLPATDVTSHVYSKPVDSPRSFRFLMVATWRPIKQPLLVLQACGLLLQQGIPLQLHIIGSGSQLPAMQALANAEPLDGHVQFLGTLPKSIIAEEMRQADALLHPSSYETFSVVCAEAISCGTPVLVSNLEAVSEFIDSSNGILVENTVDAWRDAIATFCMQPHRWNSKQIAQAAHARFSPAVVGQQLRNLYGELWLQSC